MGIKYANLEFGLVCFLALHRSDKYSMNLKNARSDVSEKPLCALKEAFAHRRVFLTAGVRELLQFLPLLGIEARRDFDDQSREQIPVLPAIDVNNSLTA